MYSRLDCVILEYRLATSELFVFSPQLIVHTPGCGFSRNYNVLRNVDEEVKRVALVASGGPVQCQKVRWFSRYIYYFVRNKKRLKLFNLREEKFDHIRNVANVAGVGTRNKTLSLDAQLTFLNSGPPLLWKYNSWY